MDKNGSQNAYKSSRPDNNPNNSANDPSERWKINLNDPRVQLHASKCQYHGQLYQQALNNAKKE